MAGEIERSGEPTTGRDIELGTTSLAKLGNGQNRPLKGLRVDRNPVADRPKIRQIEGDGPRPGQGLGGQRPSGAAEEGKPMNYIPLPDENREEGGDPERGEEGAVRGDEGRDTAPDVEPLAVVVEPPRRRCSR